MGKTVYLKVKELCSNFSKQTLSKEDLIKQIYKSIGCDDRTIKRVLEIMNTFDFVKEKDGQFKFK